MGKKFSGAFYALFNRGSLFQMKMGKNKCIRCGMCVRACPANAVSFRYGFGNGKETPKKTTMEESK